MFAVEGTVVKNGQSRAHDLLKGTRAIDKALIAVCPATDQRGEPRPLDGVGNGKPGCDVGTFEASLVPLMEIIFINSFE